MAIICGDGGGSSSGFFYSHLSIIMHKVLSKVISRKHSFIWTRIFCHIIRIQFLPHPLLKALKSCSKYLYHIISPYIYQKKLWRKERKFYYLLPFVYVWFLFLLLLFGCDTVTHMTTLLLHTYIPWYLFESFTFNIT